MPKPGFTNLRPSTANSITSPIGSERSSSPVSYRSPSPAAIALPSSTAGSQKVVQAQSSKTSEEEVIYKDARTGVEWAEGLWGWEPRWTRLPKLDDIERVCREALDLAPEDACTVTFHASGSFNRVYLVKYEKGKMASQCIMRIALPVEPGNKTECEVTTMRFVSEHTSIPVPRVIAFNDDDDNEIGFEWILMEFLPGTSLYKRWHKISLEQKAYVTEQIATFHSQLFQLEFKGVGTLRPRSKGTKGPKPGALVALDYFRGDHFDYEVPRGPFRTSHDWVKSKLQVQEIDQTKGSQNNIDEEMRDDAKYRLLAVKELKWLLPKVLAEVMHPTERTVLWHDDLHEQNILIDDNGKVTGILDWELAFAAPIWLATKFPSFLRGHVREQRPDSGSRHGASYKSDDPYWEKVEDHEKTQLRKVYVSKMATLWPEYSTLARHSELKNDLVDAVIKLDTSFPADVTRILQWVDNISLADFTRFRIIISSGYGKSDDDIDPMFRKHDPVEKDMDESDSEIDAGFLSSEEEDESVDGGDEDENKSFKVDDDDQEVVETREDEAQLDNATVPAPTTAIPEAPPVPPMVSILAFAALVVFASFFV
ncbi:Protein kinase-like domain containing protein [Naviculisporaceae sp. PSN 640]